MVPGGRRRGAMGSPALAGGDVGAPLPGEGEALGAAAGLAGAGFGASVLASPLPGPRGRSGARGAGADAKGEALGSGAASPASRRFFQSRKSSYPPGYTGA